MAEAARVALPPTKFGFCKLPSPAGAEIAGKRPLRPAHPQRWSPRPTIALSATRVRLRRRLVRGFPATFLSRGIVPFLWFRGLCGRGAETAERNWISPLRVQPGGGGELKQNDLKRVPGCGVCFFRTILVL
ncbi:protein PIGBOS1 isoform X1 [Cervus elaphus]|uniref:protein PIGBOS1 isoform X1 n=1 Tax=Cervus elaphus TaxID=9860 RepID=UPI001CC31B58|nr:protein PIGBOS1 isoform X1 [Cervus elaphus]